MIAEQQDLQKDDQEGGGKNRYGFQNPIGARHEKDAEGNFSVIHKSMVMPKMTAVVMACFDQVNWLLKSISMDLPLGGNRKSKIRQARMSMMITKGTASTIQDEKVRLTPCSRKAVNAMALGGLPMGVAMPPILAAKYDITLF